MGARRSWLSRLPYSASTGCGSAALSGPCNPGSPGHCRAIALGGSSEYLQLDRERGLAYLSFLDRDSLARGGTVNGTVMLLDLNLPDPAPRAAMTFDPGNFRPQALSLFKQAGSRRDCLPSRSIPTAATRWKSPSRDPAVVLSQEAIRDPAFVDPNAIAATGPREFYLANDSTESGAWAKAK